MISLAKHFFSFIPKNFEILFEKPLWELLDSLDLIFDTKPFEKKPPLQNVYLENEKEIFIHESCIIEPGVYIKGPVYLGKNSIVRHGAYVRPFTIAMQDNLIGHATEIKHSILFPHAKAAHFNYVGNSIIGNRVNLGAGSCLSNLRLDQKSVQIELLGEKIDTKRKKFGAIIGDDVSIGCNTTLNPGVVIEPGTHIFPSLNLKGTYPKNSIVKTYE